MTPKVAAIVIAQPVRFRESIQVLLSSISQIDEVLSFGNITDALSLAANLTPSIVILDHQVASIDLHSTLKLLCDAWQGASRIVLVEDKDEFHQAMDHRTDLVLLKGFNASKFIDAVEEILKNG
jgi:DNA-binding NarL/FixJ family response regulator